MRTINKIKEQIRIGEIEFYGSDEILDCYSFEPKNINHLTCMIIENYLYEKSLDFPDLFFRFLDYRTVDGEYMELRELVKSGERSSSFYYAIETAYYSTPIQIDINIHAYDEKESYEDYIKELFKDIKRKTSQVVNNFNPNELFTNLYVPTDGYSSKIVLYNLNKAKETFVKFVNELD